MTSATRMMLAGAAFVVIGGAVMMAVNRASDDAASVEPVPVLAVPPAPVAVPAASGSGLPRLVMYKSPYCGCCGDWGDHLRANGFEVVDHNLDDLTGTKRRYGITDRLASCHTGVIEGYVVEGHVPAEEIHRLLAERPDARGLAVPGMPIGSPGMEQGPRLDPYDILLIHNDGRTSVYASRGR